jgi:hypothetical protein
MHPPLPKRIRTKGKRVGGDRKLEMGFSEMWAGVQKEMELNEKTKSNRKGQGSWKAKLQAIKL